MEMNLAWVKDPQIFQVNRLEPHAFFNVYKDEKEYKTKKSSYVINLNGTWKFHYCEHFNDLIQGFENVDFDCSNWDDIKVPGHIQMQGYGVPMYVNQVYPWSAQENVLPGEIPENNPIGSYVTYFDKTEAMNKDQVILNFKGVESAFALWVNGTFVGYSEDSFSPSAFDITSLIVDGQNKVAVQVYRYSSGSWLEDQDFFRFSGIFRDVELLLIPSVHLLDLNVRTDLNSTYDHADIKIKAMIQTNKENYTVRFTLKDKDTVISSNESSQKEINICIPLDNPKLWSAEIPNLYQLYVEVEDENGCVEYIKQNVGVREFKMINQIMCINGKRVVFHGVNRHEFSPYTGRVVTYEETLRDIQIMKDNNINALRTSHYPNQTFVYDICDELGLYVIDETNLETHGTWSADFGSPYIVPHNKPEWRDIVLDRANSMVERDKNHPSIIIWSCGDESFGGSVIYDESQLIRSKDDTRLVHYEGIFRDRSYNDTSDMESQMYTYASDIEDFLYKHPEKPFMLCEYSHSMGNSNGGLCKYIELEKKYNKYQGGFIWDFVDQAIWADGKLNYGGDLKEGPSDFDFCGNGIVFADRTITPKMQEVKNCYQYVEFNMNKDSFEIKNNYLFRNLNEFDFTVTLYKEGNEVESKTIQLEVEPQQTTTISNPFTVEDTTSEYSIVISMTENGKEYAHGQYIYEFTREYNHASLPVELVEDFMNVGVVGENFRVIFYKTKGLTSYKVNGVEYIRDAVRPNFFRASTNNDVANWYGFRLGQWKLASEYASCRFIRTEKEDTCCKVYFEYDFPIHLGIEKVYVVYSIYGDGEITIDMNYQPKKDNPEMPAFGIMFKLYEGMDTVHYYGLGKEENYIDRNTGAVLGNYSYDVKENMTPYLVPQECGNRTGVRTISITDGSNSLGFVGEDLEFSALPYTPFEIENAKHHYELPNKYQTVVCIYEQQMGVAGDDTWGAVPHPEYRLSNDQKHHLFLSLKAK